MANKESRYVLYVGIAIVMAIMICMTTIVVDSLFGVVVSIVLLGLLCVAFGYLYCKYEDKLFVGKPKKSGDKQLSEIFGKLAESVAKKTVTEKAKEEIEVIVVENDIDKVN